MFRYLETSPITDDQRRFKSLLRQVGASGVLTVYRGGTVHEVDLWRTRGRKVLNISWMLDRAVAEKFARRFEMFFGGEPIVLEAKIEFLNALGYFFGRNEQEVVLDPADLKRGIKVRHLEPNPDAAHRQKTRSKKTVKATAALEG
ncbi:MAG TPA: hypothetical protein VNF68_15670 [Candidatus Baltobacteraceae bacterium]|nr:hypothetical protein [Candidatus Baltobacteraceae bacterium]